MTDRPEGEPTTGTPRWVKVFAIILGVLVLLIIVLVLFGGRNHGPRRHGGPADHRSPAVAGGLVFDESGT